MHKTFCVLPWYNKEFRNGNTTVCCLLKVGYNLNQVKKDLLAGIQNPNCGKCWAIEANGQQSRRQQENSFLDFKLDRNLDKIQQDCEQGTASTLLYQISTSNLCNQACVSCGSSGSSKWAELERQMGIVPKKTFVLNLDKVNIAYQHAQRIEILGGEPLFEPTTVDILEKLLEHNNTDCFISFVTNGSIQLTEKQKALFANFKNLNICISIDGTGPVFEYMRWPGKWDELISNIEQYQTLTQNISVSYTVSSLNALYYNETVSWFNHNNLPFNHNLVSRPLWLSLKFAPIEIKQELLKQNNFISNFAAINGQEISLEKYRCNLQAQDTVKKIQMQDYLPKIAEIINLI